MHQPNPWILLIGGFALFNVAGMVYGSKAPEWVRLVAALAFAAMGATSLVLAVKRQYGKKPTPPPKPVKKLAPARDAAKQKTSSGAGEPS